MGRSAAGAKGIQLEPGQEVISLVIVKDGAVLVATENGFGKRTLVDDFPSHHRGGRGVIAIQTSARNGRMVGAVQVNDDDEVMLISAGGTLVRTAVAGISVLGRNTQGVRLIRLAPDERLVGLDRIASINQEI